METEEHFRSTTFESLITTTVIPFINGKKIEKETICFDRTSNCTVNEVISTFAVKYRLSSDRIVIKIPNEDDTPLYTVQGSLLLSQIGDSSILYACFNTV